tara:strand:+ start:514 stop:624 length:111 start_codon:yes stop_codon:yes gene_type:complete
MIFIKAALLITFCQIVGGRLLAEIIYQSIKNGENKQ